MRKWFLILLLLCFQITGYIESGFSQNSSRWVEVPVPNQKSFFYDTETLLKSDHDFVTWYKVGNSKPQRAYVDCSDRVVNGLSVPPEDRLEYYWKHFCQPKLLHPLQNFEVLPRMTFQTLIPIQEVSNTPTQ